MPVACAVSGRDEETKAKYKQRFQCLSWMAEKLDWYMLPWE
jgi:hypothetical protein